jgi:uncharacterized protein YbbC (DUF1343 family)
MPVELASERSLLREVLRGRRIGIVCNPASVDSRLAHIVDQLRRDAELTVAAVFGPQHGFRADLQDNMLETPHGRDESRRLPVFSLYSETREPTAEMLTGVDTLVVDLQDVGSRIYTFVYTMANCLRAARRHGVRVVVLDRPNPIGGVAVEGPVLESGYESFVGQFPIPMRHGMTIGELARLFNQHFEIGAELEVVPMRGWQRSMFFDDTGLPWIMPSPNMPALETAVVYPGTVLFEGTELSEGRGTTRPFELVGAPWIDAEAFANEINLAGLPGVHFRPVYFIPIFHKHAGKTCGGCQIHVTDRHAFRPVLTGVALLCQFRLMAPSLFGWRQPPYEYEYEKMPIDILAGSDRLRQRIESGDTAGAIAGEWDEAVEAFAPVREKYLLYPGS